MSGLRLKRLCCPVFRAVEPGQQFRHGQVELRRDMGIQVPEAATPALGFVKMPCSRAGDDFLGDQAAALATTRVIAGA